MKNRLSAFNDKSSANLANGGLYFTFFQRYQFDGLNWSLLSIGNYPKVKFYYLSQSFGTCQMFILSTPMRNTDLVFFPTDNVVIPPRERMKLFLLAGIGFVLVGIISILLIYMILY